MFEQFIQLLNHLYMETADPGASSPAQTSDETGASQTALNTGNSDANQNTGEPGGDFTAEQQASLQKVVDRTLARGIERGKTEMLTDLGITAEQLPQLKTILAQVQANGGTPQGTPQGTEAQSQPQGTTNPDTGQQPDTTTKPRSKAESELIQLRTQHQAFQESAQEEITTLKAELERQKDVAHAEKRDNAILAMTANYTLASTVTQEEILNLFRPFVKISDETGSPQIVDADGNEQIDMMGNPTTMQQLGERVFNERKHLLAPGKSGSGTTSIRTTGQPDALESAVQNYQPGAIRDALANNPDLLQEIQELATSKADINPFAQARMRKEQK